MKWMKKPKTNFPSKKHLKMVSGYNKSRVVNPAFIIFRIHFFSEAGEPCEAKPGNPKISFCEALINNMGTRYFSGNPHKNHIFLANFVDYFTFFLSLNIFMFFIFSSYINITYKIIVIIIL